MRQGSKRALLYAPCQMSYRVCMEEYLGLPLVEFSDQSLLRDWLIANHTSSKGVWVRVYKVGSVTPSITFGELLDQGLCFGWSESLRHKGDALSYLQKFTPRCSKGTASQRNLDHAEKLIAAGQMTPAGLEALGI